MAKERTRSATTTEGINRHEIERLAYEFWLNRGCPLGSADQDWLDAERTLQAAAASPSPKTTRTTSNTAMKAAG